MNILERDLEEIIFKTSPEDLIKRGLCLKGIIKRQLKIGNYGISDLIYITKEGHGYNSFLKINVCELKKEKAGISAFLQAIRYCKGISSYLNKRGVQYKLDITIIGEKIDTDSDYIFICDLVQNNCMYMINNIYNYSYEYCFDGVFFKRHSGYDFVNRGFNFKKHKDE